MMRQSLGVGCPLPENNKTFLITMSAGVLYAIYSSIWCSTLLMPARYCPDSNSHGMSAVIGIIEVVD